MGPDTHLDVQQLERSRSASGRPNGLASVSELVLPDVEGGTNRGARGRRLCGEAAPSWTACTPTSCSGKRRARALSPSTTAMNPTRQRWSLHGWCRTRFSGAGPWVSDPASGSATIVPLTLVSLSSPCADPHQPLVRIFPFCGGKQGAALPLQGLLAGRNPLLAPFSLILILFRAHLLSIHSKAIL